MWIAALSFHSRDCEECRVGGEMRSGLFELCRLKTTPAVCPYLPTETATFEYRVIAALSAREYEQLLARGWRRFGHQFFRPACRSCVKCRSLRVLVGQFEPSQSQRRTLRRNSHVELLVQRPTVTQEHLRLYNAYHADMHSRRGWTPETMTEEIYRRTYLSGPGDFAREFLYWSEGKLVGVGLADVLPTCLSSVSFFHDPAYRAHALGVFSVLRQLQFAREHLLQHQYLGYWIPECRSMAYKSQYAPHEVLHHHPDDCEEPVWVQAERASPQLNSSAP
jgi:leucyl-tRNA---protein transferase